MSTKNNFKNGIKAEKKVANQLRKAGAKVEQSTGSRGPADLQADFGTKKWLVQVKSGENPPTNLTGTELQRLNQMATKRNATPVLAIVTESGVEYRSTRNNRKLKP